MCLYGSQFFLTLSIPWYHTVDPEGSNEVLVDWRAKVGLNFSWLFIGSKAIFFYFLLFIAFRFGHIKLGRNDEKAEFSDGSYFAMIFAAGVAVGLFVFGVSEPLYHRSDHWYANSQAGRDDKDNYAIFLTLHNWAISGWAPYLIVAICMGIGGHRFNLPMTFRSCFYPILGDYTWGWLGDMIDGVTIVVTVAGVCTSLGLGAIQIVAGFQYLGWVDEDASGERLSTIQNLTIWGITCISTASVLSGLDAGIKFLSCLAFGLGMFLLSFVFIMDNTKYLMNMVVQQVGYFLQYDLAQLNWWTDAFGQLRTGEGRSIDGEAGAVWWMSGWMIFYQAWWVSWSAFVGLFVARISRGRTIGQVVLYSMVAPILYCLIWFVVWGGVAIRQARQAEELIDLGDTVWGDKAYYATAENPNCYDVPQGSETGPSGEIIFTNTMNGVTPVCVFHAPYDYSAYNLLYSFSFPESFDSGFGPFLTVIFIISLAIYFATSSDSGSLVVDHLSANGRKHHHWVQRLFWAVTEGAVATAILSAGGDNGLVAVQAASIVAGLPFNFLLVYLMQSIWLFCKHAAEDENDFEYHPPKGKTFTTPIYGGIFNILELATSCGKVNEHRISKGMDKPKPHHYIGFAEGVAAPGLSLIKVLNAAYPENPKTNIFNAVLYSLQYYCFIALFIVYSNYPGMIGMAWVVFFCAATQLTVIRSGFRHHYSIRSNIVGDAIASTFFWPQVMVQMKECCDELGLPHNKKEDDIQENVREVVEKNVE